MSFHSGTSFRAITGSCTVFALCGAAYAQSGPTPPTFRGVGDLPGGGYGSRALGVGRFEKPEVVVGESLTADGWRAFILTLPSPITELPSLAPADQFSSAASVGRTRMGFLEPQTVIGSSGIAPSVGEASAARWTGTPFAAQGMGPSPGYIPSVARAISDNGRVIVGDGLATAGGARAFRWSEPTGVQELGSLPGAGPDGSSARAVSTDGSVIAGSARDAAAEIVAMRWTAATGMVALGHLNTSGLRESRAFACSADGSVIAGESTSPNGQVEAFRWTSAGGIVGLGDLPGGAFRSGALAMTAKGDRIVGWSETAAGERAFTWDAANGMRDLQAVMAGLGMPSAGWELTRANAISPAGTLIAGDGVNSFGAPEGWVFQKECYWDCNGDGRHTVNDYGCFQTRFMLGHWWADCNGSNSLTIADFPCWKDSAMSSNCP